MRKRTVLIMVTIVGIALVGASVFAKDLGMNYMENPFEQPSTNSTNLADENTSLIEVSSVKQDDDNKNIIDVHFTTKVMWDNNASITSLTDAGGNSYSAKIIDKDDDDLEIYVEGIKDGTNYTADIQGIKAYNDNSYTNLKVTFETEKTKETSNNSKSSLKVKEVDFDREDKEVSFDFDKNIKLKSGAYVIIKDSNGNAYSSKNSRIICDEDDIELFLDKNLKQGQKYTYEINGIKENVGNSYETINGSFTAYDD
ncbi:Ig-like domain-containing protein [Anaerofustis stercorihominis]|uniref:Ig-like domain-containing protein n=1 Tax=Anaerofustis stercorihominis TaxID=214853 RepID=UPI001105DE99|nr:Ig-like domain-containing protein [Anaerofustis stercorihominis]